MTNARAFEEEMIDIWEEGPGSVSYDKYNDATIYARERWSATPGAPRMSTTVNQGTFPDGTECWVNKEGKSVTTEFER